VKHRRTAWFQVLGWRRVVPGRFAGLLLGEAGRIVGCAALGMPAEQRQCLFDLLERYGEPGGEGEVLLPGGLEAQVQFLERTPQGQLREAIARGLLAAN
jgi:hypothetical protein